MRSAWLRGQFPREIVCFSTRTGTPLLALDARLVDNIVPLLDVSSQTRQRLLWRACLCNDPYLAELFLHVGHGEDLAHRLVHRVDNFLRGVLGHADAVPGN